MSVLKIALLVNSKAGKGKALKLCEYLKVQFHLRNSSYEAHIDVWPENLSAYAEAWVVGGDGTLNFFLNKYPACNIPIVIFKGGTGNDIAWKLYGDITTEQQLQHVLQASAKPVDAGRCNDKIFINGIGIGFDGEVLQSIKAIRFIGGHLGYLVAVIKKIFSFSEHHFSITIDGKRISERFLLMLIFNSSRTGGGFHVAPAASVNDGLLNTIFCKPLSILQRLRYLPAIEKGKHLQLPFIIHTTCNEISINCKTTLAAQCDGELIYAKEFMIQVLAGRFFFKY